jgi:hypothetical protein
MSMIHPVLKNIHSPDIGDLNNPHVDETGPFCILLQAMFGIESSEGEESFDILVCNPKWIDQHSKVGPFDGRHHLIVSKFDIKEIQAYLINIARHCSAQTWEEAAQKLGRTGKWEFEDYLD